MIKDLQIKEILNSRKEKTIKAILKTDKGIFSGCAPSGKSRGKYEAKTFTTDKIFKIFKRNKKILLEEILEFKEKEIDDSLCLNIGAYGANFCIALSIAGWRAISKNNIWRKMNPKAKIFPYPLGNAVGGGVHGGGTDIQEFLVIPIKAKTIKEAIITNLNIYNSIGRVLKEKKVLTGKNNEGAWTSKLNDIETLSLVSNIAEEYDARVGLDLAASQLYKDRKYHYKRSGIVLKDSEQLDFVLDLIRCYNLFYVEDPFNENEFGSFSQLTKKTRCLIVGDDLFATNPMRLKKGIKKKAANGIIIKPDQIGTISKALQTVRIAKKAGYTTIVSHRSGETLDDFISDFAVGTNSQLIKCGIYGKERVAKLKRLIKIWNEIKNPKMYRFK